MGEKINIKKMIKNKDISNLVKSLNQDGYREKVVHALFQLAKEGYVKDIVKNKGIKQLAECLKNENYNVRKESADTLILIAKNGFKDDIVKSGAYGTVMEVMGEMYKKNGRKDKAIETYKKLIEKYPHILHYYDLYLKEVPDDINILFKKGKLLYERMKYKECYDIMLKITKKEENNKDALIYGGYASLKLKKYDDAINLFEKAIKMDNKNVELWKSLSDAYRKVGEYEDSLRCIEEAIKIEQNNPEIWYLKAMIEFSMVEYEHALNSINKSLDLKEDINALLLKRDILKHMNSPLELIKTCRRLIELGKDEADIYYDIAKSYYDTGDYDGATKILSKISEEYLYHIPTLNLQKEILKKKEQWELIIPICETILKVNPSDIEAYIDIALSYEKLGKYEDSLKFLKNATKIDPNNDKIKKLMSDIEKKSKK